MYTFEELCYITQKGKKENKSVHYNIKTKLRPQYKWTCQTYPQNIKMQREQGDVCLSFTQVCEAPLKSCQEFAQMNFICLFTMSQRSLYQ